MGGCLYRQRDARWALVDIATKERTPGAGRCGCPRPLDLGINRVFFSLATMGFFTHPTTSRFADSSLLIPSFLHFVMSRPLRAAPIVPTTYWCLKCFRTSLKAYKPRTHDWPFEIDCKLDAAGSILCQQCSTRRANCETVQFPHRRGRVTLMSLGGCRDAW